jgi:hypothetical protein
MKNINTILAVGAVTAVCGAAEAALVTIAGWDFSTITANSTAGTAGFGASPYGASVSAAGLSVGGLTRGAGVSGTVPSGGSSAAKGWGGTGFNSTSPITDAVGAVNASKFVFFSISTDGLSELSISSIDAYNVRRSSSGPTSGQWQYQVGTGAFVNIGSTITWGSTTSSSGNAQTAIDLSTISDLQGIAANTTVTFRLALWGASSASGTWYFNGQSTTADPDFKLTGSVNSIPAPGAMALLGVAGLLGARRRR